MWASSGHRYVSSPPVKRNTNEQINQTNKPSLRSPQTYGIYIILYNRLLSKTRVLLQYGRCPIHMMPVDVSSASSALTHGLRFLHQLNRRKYDSGSLLSVLGLYDCVDAHFLVLKCNTHNHFNSWLFLFQLSMLIHNSFHQLFYLSLVRLVVSAWLSVCRLVSSNSLLLNVLFIWMTKSMSPRHTPVV